MSEEMYYLQWHRCLDENFKIIVAPHLNIKIVVQFECGYYEIDPVKTDDGCPTEPISVERFEWWLVDAGSRPLTLPTTRFSIDLTYDTFKLYLNDVEVKRDEAIAAYLGMNDV